jgi:hypothetical protein
MEKLILPTRISLEELFHQEDLLQPVPKSLSCNKFGHKTIDCKTYAGHDHVRDINKDSYETTKND